MKNLHWHECAKTGCEVVTYHPQCSSEPCFDHLYSFCVGHNQEFAEYVDQLKKGCDLK